MITLLIALGLGALSAIPSLLNRMVTKAFIAFISITLLMYALVYLTLPTFVGPLFGVIGLLGLLSLVLGGLIAMPWTDMDENSRGSHRSRTVNQVNMVVLRTATLPMLLFCTHIIILFSGTAMLRSNSYARMLGDVQKREWTQDVQPKDPKHVRLVPTELASWLADKQLGSATGAIGSQFQVDHDHMTLQMIKGELWYVAPLDFKGFSAWTATDGAPGYVMVHGEDPLRPVELKAGYNFRYMPGAYWNDNLERYLWLNGYYKEGLTDYSLEVDDNGKPWWVVTRYTPTVAWWAPKVLGVVVVDPVSGSITEHQIGSVPDWIDRVVPAEFVVKYATWRGKYHGGWWNSVWAHKDITQPEVPNVVYGADGLPYWVTGQTSSNENDESLVGVYYTCTRTGKTTLYHAVGGTDAAVLNAVNNKVSYKKWHGASPSLYNIYGHMTSVVPLLGENHTFMGVALVRVDNLEVVDEESSTKAFRKYQAQLSQTGQNVAFNEAHDRNQITGTVSRIAAEVKGSETVYYVYLEGTPHIFTAASEPWHKLPLTHAGDKVTVAYVDTGEDIIPILEFDNPGLMVTRTKTQEELQQRVTERTKELADQAETRTARGEVQNMSDEELRELMKHRDKK